MKDLSVVEMKPTYFSVLKSYHFLQQQDIYLVTITVVIRRVQIESLVAITDRMKKPTYSLSLSLSISRSLLYI